ncbi:MAG: S-layer homology domain-containing protein, partial [Clostridia bacterium]|nr:S-layer homology domain-containing protein [Clostridia bacterium]
NSAIAPYAIKSVTALASAGYLKGDGISFRPTDFVTRGETAALIGRIISKI